MGNKQNLRIKKEVINIIKNEKEGQTPERFLAGDIKTR